MKRSVLLSSVIGLSLTFSVGSIAQTSSFEEARKLIKEQQYKEAITYLNKLEVSADEEAVKYQLLADAFLMNGAGISAEAALDRARRLGADYATTAIPYAKALLLQGKYEAAINAIAGVNVPEKDLRDSYIISGDANFAEGAFKLARQSYLEAQAKDPEDFQSYLGIARLDLREGHMDEAKVSALKAEEYAPGNTMVQYTLGLIARYQGETDKAEKYFLKAVTLFEDNILANLELANIKINENKIEQAESYLDKVYTLSRNQPMALYLSAVIEASRGNYTEAAALLNRTQGLSDTYLPAVYVKGMVAYEQEKFDIAIKALTKVLQVRPDNRVARMVLASSYAKSLRPNTALTVLEPLLKTNAPDVNVLTIAAAAAMSSGNAELGKEYYEKAAKLKEAGAPGGTPRLTSKLALAEYAAGDTSDALATLSSITAGTEIELREMGMMGSMQIRLKDYEAAAETIERIITFAPNRALGYNMRGTLEFKQRQFEEAIQSFSQALEISQDYYTALRNRGLAYMRTGDYKKSESDLKRLLKAKPSDTLAKAALAKTLLSMGQYEESVDYFREALRVIPKSLKLSADFAEALAGAGNTTQAIQQARKAAVMAEDKPEYLKRMGLLLLKLKEPAAAERPLSRYAAYNPRSGEAHLLHGRALLLMGLYTGSSLSFNRAASSSEDVPDLDVLNWYLFKSESLGNQYDKAGQRLSRLKPEKRPEDIDASVVGDFLLAMGEPEKAENAYRAALKTTDENGKVVIGLSNVLEVQGQAEEALSTLVAYLKKKPGDRQVLEALGQFYMRQGNFEKASLQYEKVLRSGVADARTAATLASIYLKLGNNLSIKLASNAHLMMPDDPYVQDVYGWVMLQAGRNTEEAIPVLEKAVRRAPANPVYKFHLGMAYLARGQRVDAKEVLHQALKLDPTFEGADEARRQLSLLEY